jgi:type I restriction enzyme S subunit
MWEMVKLGDVLKTSAGGTPLKSRKEFYENGDVAWLLSGEVCSKEITSSSNVITEEGLKNSSAKIFPSNTVLVAMYGATAGQVGILRFDCATNQAVCGIYPSEKYLPEFLYYYLTSYKEILLEQVSGVAQPNLSQEKIKNIPLPLPPLREQQRIVEKLDSAFEEIDRAIEATELKKDGVNALKSAVLSQELSASSDSKTVKLGEVYEVGSSKRVLKSEWRESGIAFYRGREITSLSKDGYVDNELYIEESHYEQLRTQYGVPKKDDIMITAIGTIGNTYIVKNEDIFYFKDASVLWLKKTSDINSKFVKYWLKSEAFTSQLDRGNGATVDTLTISKLQSVELPLPPLREQQRIVEKLDKAFALADEAAKAFDTQLSSYKALKSAILAQELKGPE